MAMPQPKKGKDKPKIPYSPMPMEAMPGAKMKGPDPYSTGALDDSETGNAYNRYASDDE